MTRTSQKLPAFLAVLLGLAMIAPIFAQVGGGGNGEEPPNCFCEVGTCTGGTARAERYCANNQCVCKTLLAPCFPGDEFNGAVGVQACCTVAECYP